MTAQIDPYPFDDTHKQFLSELCATCNRTAEVIRKSIAAELPYQQYADTNSKQKAVVAGLLKQFWGINPEDL